MTFHYLSFTPLRDVQGRLVELDCWLDRTLTAVAMDCACGHRLRMLTEEDLGVPLTGFWGDPSDEVLATLMAALESSPHAVEMVPALRDLQEPVDAVAPSRLPSPV
jgi:hypothetical protein